MSKQTNELFLSYQKSENSVSNKFEMFLTMYVRD